MPKMTTRFLSHLLNGKMMNGGKTEERLVFKNFKYAVFEAFQIFMEYLGARLFSS